MARKKKKPVIESVYERDADTGAFIVRAALDGYADIFHEWDPSPFRKRDLNPELMEYLDECSRDIPLKRPIVLSFTIPEKRCDRSKEERIITGLRTYFSVMMDTLRRDIRQSYRKVAYYVITAFAFLAAAYFIRHIAGDNVVFSTFTEGLYIGGWVFLWEAISALSFRNRDIRKKHKHFRRFQKAPIRFECVAEG
jgi:hypothetical protein